jgi:hypothetical protein
LFGSFTGKHNCTAKGFLLKAGATQVTIRFADHANRSIPPAKTQEESLELRQPLGLGVLVLVDTI